MGRGGRCPSCRLQLNDAANILRLCRGCHRAQEREQERAVVMGSIEWALTPGLGCPKARAFVMKRREDFTILSSRLARLGVHWADTPVELTTAHS
jgi:hypothetical protein